MYYDAYSPATAAYELLAQELLKRIQI